MKRAALISIPVLTIVLFCFVMNSGFLFLKPGGYDLQAHLGQIGRDVLNGDWQSVENEMGRLEYMFGRKIRFRPVQLKKRASGDGAEYLAYKGLHRFTGQEYGTYISQGA